MFAEKAHTALTGMETIAARTVDTGLDPADRLALIRAKSAAAQAIPALNELLYPEDEPVG